MYKLNKKNIRGLAIGLVATTVMATIPTSNVYAAETPDTITTVEEDSTKKDIFGRKYTGWETKTKEGIQEVIYKEAFEPAYITREYTGFSNDDGVETKDLYLLRVEGDTYFATCVTDETENNMIHKYYAIDTNEFLGQTLEVNWYSRAFINAKNEFTDEYLTLPEAFFAFKGKKVDISTKENLQDQEYFNGEYGLGKNLPKEAVINASEIFGDTKLTKSQIDEFISNPVQLAQYTDNYQYSYYNATVKEKYTMQEFIDTVQNYVYFVHKKEIGYKTQKESISNPANKFIFKTDEGKKGIVGYRISSYPEDSGYNYIYDIESSNIIDLSNYYKLVDITVPPTELTVSNIRSSLRHPMETSYDLDQLFVLGTQKLDGDDVFEKYYIITRNNYEDQMEEVIQFNSVGEKELIVGYYDWNNIRIQKDLYSKSTGQNGEAYELSTLRDCLEDNHFDTIIKDTYSEQELATILAQFRKTTLKLNSESTKQEAEQTIEHVKLEDIIVVDTTKYDEQDSTTTIKNTDTQYFILMPYDMPGNSSSIINAGYYETWNHGAGAVVVPNGIRIDTLSKVLFLTLNDDGNLQCISSLEDVLNENGYFDEIKDEYIIEELGSLQSKLNCLKKQLIKR